MAGPRLNQTLIYWLIASPAIIVMVALFLVPLGRILLISISEVSPQAEGLRLGNYSLLYSEPGIVAMMLRTVRICVITTVLTVLIGYVIAYAMTQVSERERTWLLFCVLMSFWVSVLVRTFAWLILLRPNGGAVHAVVSLFYDPLVDAGMVEGPLRLVRNEAGIMIGMIHFMIPYAVLPILANMRGVDRNLMAAARGLGAGRRQAFWLVFFPLSRPGLVAAGVLVFIYSFGFFVIPAIMGGGRSVMIAEYIWFSVTQTVRWGLAAMLATTLLVTVFGTLAIAARWIDMKSLFGAKAA